MDDACSSLVLFWSKTPQLSQHYPLVQFFQITNMWVAQISYYFGGCGTAEQGCGRTKKPRAENFDLQQSCNSGV
jgi:hypothetical protein